MLYAKKYLGAVNVGVTAPVLVRADDGAAYVVKLKNNRLGTKVLVNEYIASRFAEYVDLCFPPSGVISFAAEFVAGSRRLSQRKALPGLHFASKFISHTSYVHRYHMGFVKNKEQIAGIMLFDHLTHNEDRTLNGKNMLLKRESDGYILYAIDNSHLFGSGRWRTENLPVWADRIKINRRRAYGTMLKHYLRPEDFQPYVEQFKMMNEEKIAGIVSSIPSEWLDDEAAKTALVDFLVKRCGSVELIAEKLVEFIPDVHRGSNTDQ